MKVIEDRAPEGVVTDLGPMLVPTIICDQCGEPITDLGDALTLLAMEPGKQARVVHSGKGRNCDPGDTPEHRAWEPLLDMFWQLLWNFALQHEGKHGRVRVTHDLKKAGALSCTINGTGMGAGGPIRWQIIVKLDQR